MSDTDHQKPGIRPLALDGTVEGAKVSDSLIDGASHHRAANIAYREEAMRQHGTQQVDFRNPMATLLERLDFTQGLPEEYVVHYYLVDAKTPTISKAFDSFYSMKDEVVESGDGDKPDQKVPRLRPDNQPVALNDAMQQSVFQAFATIQAQLPGRFRFVRTTDPQEASISIAGVPLMRDASGVASSATGAILLESSNFQEADSVANTVALHEILHALGLRHPQEHGITTATYYDTVMTYDVNNQSAPQGGAGALPVSLMPADIQALVRLYPVARDAQEGVAQSGYPLMAHVPTPFVLEQKDIASRQSVLRPEEGIVYQPYTDTAHDALRVHPVEHNQDSYVWVTQRTHGIEINDNLAGMAYATIHVEQMELAGSMSVVTQGNVVLDGTHELTDYVHMYLSGKENHLHVAAANMNRIHAELKPGAELKITLKSDGKGAAGYMHFSYDAEHADISPDQMKAQWKPDGLGGYNVQIMPAGKPEMAAQIHMVLEGIDPVLRSRVEAQLEFGSIMVKDDTSRRAVPLTPASPPVPEEKTYDGLPLVFKRAQSSDKER